MAFRVAAAQCKKIGSEMLNWPARLAGILKGHVGFQKKKIYFSPLFLTRFSRFKSFSSLKLAILGGVLLLQNIFPICKRSILIDKY